VHCQRVDLHVLCVHGVSDVGKCIGVVDGCTRELCNLLLDLVSDLGHVGSTLIIVATSGSAAAVVHIRVVCFHEEFEVALGLLVVVFDEGGLVLPVHHLGLVEHVGIVDLLKLELQLVFIGDGDVRTNQRVLIIVESFPKGGEVLKAVPFCKVCVLQLLL
jgi:hypothetical protein